MLCHIYLLSADSCLWRRAKQSAKSRIIMLNSIRLTNISEDGYVFLGAATFLIIKKKRED